MVHTILIVSFLLSRYGAESLENQDDSEDSGLIHFAGLDCTGTETSIMQCPSSHVASANCSHSHDASVRCQTGKTKNMSVHVSYFGLYYTTIPMTWLDFEKDMTHNYFLSTFQ